MVDNSSTNMSLFEEEEVAYRPIHYLGSKLRIVDTISNILDEIDPSYGRVYDIFAGSGTVSSYLGRKRPVTSIDIQEYSRVITSAILQPFYEDEFDEIKKTVENNKVTDLQKCFHPLISYEKKSLREAASGNIYEICELIEHGAILPFLKNKKRNKSKELEKALNETVNNLKSMNLLESPSTTTTRYFGGSYFSYEQASQMDNLLNIASMFEGRVKDLIIAVTLSTASEVVNTVGKQFAQPLKALDREGNPKNSIINKVLKERNLDVYEIFNTHLNMYFNLEKGNFNHESLREDVFTALDNISEDTKVVYADPPYTRYHYSRYYHVLETMSLRDNPAITMVKTNSEEKMSRGLYRDDRHQSPFSIKSKSDKAFNDLFDKVSRKGISLILSYSPYEKKKESTPRIQTIDELIKKASKYYHKVEVVPVEGFIHSKLNSTDKNFKTPTEAEVLIVCTQVNQGVDF